MSGLYKEDAPKLLDLPHFFPMHIYHTAAAAAKSLQSCPTLCDPIDGSPPDSAIPGILQARTLEWVAISFSNAWKWKVKVKSLSRVQLLATPQTAAYQALPSMGVSRQEYWSGVPFPSLILILCEWKGSRFISRLSRLSTEGLCGRTRCMAQDSRIGDRGTGTKDLVSNAENTPLGLQVMAVG